LYIHIFEQYLKMLYKQKFQLDEYLWIKVHQQIYDLILDYYINKRHVHIYFPYSITNFVCKFHILRYRSIPRVNKIGFRMHRAPVIIAPV